MSGLSRATVVLKVLFGVGILAWMVMSGKLNLTYVWKGLSQWPLMLVIVSCVFSQVAITTIRWRLLLEAQDLRLSFRRTWGLTMIGMLFNAVIPGAVGGDLIKGYYITRATGCRKSGAATSIVVDRVAGLTGLLLLGAVMVCVNWHDTVRSPATRGLGVLTLSGGLGGMIGLYVAVLAGNRFSETSFFPRALRHVLRALGEYHKQSSAIYIALALSVLNQALSCAAYYLALRAGGVDDMPLSLFFLVVPLGLVAIAIPVSPAGVGVGQAAFFTLFKLVAPRYAAAGADALTVFQVMFILVCLSGTFWYVSYKQPVLDPAVKRDALEEAR